MLNQLEEDLNPTAIFKMLCEVALNFGGNLPLTYKDLEFTQELNVLRNFSNDIEKTIDVEDKWWAMMDKRKEESKKGKNNK